MSSAEIYNMDDSLDFTDDEIREELNKLGYSHVPDSRLSEFKKDLGRLIHHEKSKGSSQDTSHSSYYHQDSTRSFTGDAVPRVPAAHVRIPQADSSPERQDDSLTTGPKQYEYQEYRKDMRHFDGGLDPTKLGEEPRIPQSKIAGDYSLQSRDADQSQLSHRDDVSEADSERRMVKRKVLRKEKDGSKRIDESMSESDTGSLMDINARLRQLGIADSVDFFDRRRPQSAQSEPPYRLSKDDQRPASVILRKPDHPHTRNLKKNDPVDRYKRFRQSWDHQRAPGEKNHKNLRWNIREQMLAQDVVYEKKPHRVFVPNKFVVPSDKNRNSLRWQIRMDMAQGELPHHGFYQQF